MGKINRLLYKIKKLWFYHRRENRDLQHHTSDLSDIPEIKEAENGCLCLK